MAKGFSKNNPLDKLSGTQPTAPVTHEEPDVAAVETTEPKKVKTTTPKKPVEGKKRGRPTLDDSGRKKKDYTKTINIAVPIDLLEKADVAKICYSNNLTEYLNKLIEKDIEANYERYKQIADSLNSFK